MDPLLKYKIAINLIPGIGCVIAKRIIGYLGSIEAVFNEKKENLIKIPGIGKYLAYNINTSKALNMAEKELDFIHKNKIQAIFYLDKNFPERLRHCEDGPLLLFTKGAKDLNNPKILSIVGTRLASSRGKETCDKIIVDLANKGHEVIIVSGLAYGIDITAHKSALNNSLKTVAVLAHGLDTIYPNLHRNIAKKILNNGGLITEFFSKTELERNNFIKRNRIIAGLADATIIIESKEKGGAMITADLANSYDRDVFAVPGRINDISSKGCNMLIKNNLAHLIEKADDIEYFLDWNVDLKKNTVQKKLFPELSTEEQSIVQILLKGQQNIDQISKKAGLPTSKVCHYLLKLEFSGNIKSLPGSIYTISGLL